MLGEFVNWLWQATVRFLRWGIWPNRQKPSLMVAIGKRQKANALEEYRRRFELAGDQGFRKAPAQPDPGPAEMAQLFEGAEPGHRFGPRDNYRQDARVRRRARPRGGSVHFFGVTWAFLNMAGRRLRWSGLTALIVGCTIALGGAYLYRTMKSGSDDSIPIDHASEERKTEKQESIPGRKKLTYARLTPDGPADESPAVPSARTVLPMPSNAGADHRTDGAVPEGAQAGNASASPQTVAARGQAANKRTIVRSETYLPDGTRVDVVRAAPIPSVVRLGTAKPQPPFLAAAQPPEAAAARAAAEKDGTSAAGPAEANAVPAAAPVPAAEPAASLEIGYFAQVKADQDQKAAEAELATISEKYKAVLGEVPLKTRPADLKEKGVWIRVLAGPLKSRDDAANLCKKLKGAGIEACIVQKIE